MTAQALTIVQEEITELRKGILPNSRIIWQNGGDVKTHDLLTVLEAKLTERIMNECHKET